MSQPTTVRAPLVQPTLTDWAKVGVVILLWGSAFFFTGQAVASVPPAVVVMGRLWLGAALLIVYMLARGHRLPALRPRPDIRWGWFTLLGLTGNAVPFLLISWGQQETSSGVAGALMALMPGVTAVLAALALPDERMTPMKAVGFALGLAGVLILIGPDALSDLGGAATLAQLAILAATVCYATNTIIARKAPETPGSVLAAGMLIMGALIATPAGLMALAQPGVTLDTAAVWAIVGLGAGSTGLASIIYVDLVRRLGASFLALVNYMVPLTAVLLGWLAGESLPAQLAPALAVTLAGVAVARRSHRPDKPRL